MYHVLAYGMINTLIWRLELRLRPLDFKLLGYHGRTELKYNKDINGIIKHTPN